LQDEGVRYRGRDASELARSQSFEQVAELLWSGSLSGRGLSWTVDREGLARCRHVLTAAEPNTPIASLTLSALTLGQGAEGHDAPAAARRLLAIAPSLLGGPVAGDIASRLAAAYRRRPSTELVAAVSRALVLLADHELATSTLAVRVACSVRADPYAAIAAGLCVVGGPLHGTASTVAAELLDDALAGGARDAVDRVLSSGRRLPGFGHSVYRNGDPRLAPLLEAVRALPDPAGRMRVVEDVLVEAGRRLGQLPNVDLGLGALAFVADLPRDASLFAIARIAGWAAHYEEEKAERPVRFRGITTRR
jgi:citrate synthase